MRFLLTSLQCLALAVCVQSPVSVRAQDPTGKYANSPNAAWYKQQQPTPETLKAYDISWDSCCNLGDVCKTCVVHKYSQKPPWRDSWWYTKDGKTTQLPPHIVEYVPWTPTGKPVLFLAPYDARKLKKGEPVCLKVPGGATQRRGIMNNRHAALP